MVTASGCTPGDRADGIPSCAAAPRRPGRRAARRRPRVVGPGRRGRRDRDGRDRARRRRCRSAGRPRPGSRAGSAGPPNRRRSGRAVAPSTTGPPGAGSSLGPSRPASTPCRSRPREDGTARGQGRGAGRPQPTRDHRRPGLRPRGARRPRPRARRRPGRRSRLRRAPRATCSSSPSSARSPRRTCFCTSMGTGPEVTHRRRRRPRRGRRRVRRRAPARRPGSGCSRSSALAPAGDDRRRRGRARQVAAARAAMGARGRRPRACHDRLLANLDTRAGTQIAERCLACANCTLVCPTCFCTGTVDQLRPRRRASRPRRGPGTAASPPASRRSPAAASGRTHADRYRQWLTHKFGTWWDQFGSSGCVGCGRCIAWCPVGHRRPRGARDHRRPGDRAGRAGATVAAADRHRGPASCAMAPAALQPRLDPHRLRDRDGRRRSAGDRRHDDAPPRDRRPADSSPAAPGQFVMVARARVRDPADLHLAHPSRRPGAHDPRRRSRDQLPDAAAAGRDARPARPARRGRGRSRTRTAGTSSIVAGGIGLAPLRGRSSSRCSPSAIASRPSGSTSGRGRRVTGCSSRRSTPSQRAATRRPRRPSTGPGRSGSGASGSSPSSSGTRSRDGPDVTAFICGPERMMAAVGRRPRRPRRPPRAHLADPRAAHGVRRRAVRPLPARDPVRLPGRSRLLRRRARRRPPAGGPVMDVACAPVAGAGLRRAPPTLSRPRVGVVKFASCDGCQLTILDLEDELLALDRAVRDRRVRRGDLAPLVGPVRRPPRRGLHLHARAGRRDRPPPRRRRSSSSRSARARPPAASRRCGPPPSTRRSGPRSIPRPRSSTPSRSRRPIAELRHRRRRAPRLPDRRRTSSWSC